MSAWSDTELLHDETQPAESFAVFYRRHVDAMVRFAAVRGMDADAAADLVSETFFAALKSRQRYVEQHDSARLWLLGIATRRLADTYRRRDRDRRRAEKLQGEAIVLTQEDRDDYAALIEGADGQALDALGDLPLTQQRAIRGRILEERSYADVAEALGLNEPNARKHVSRGLAALRRNLKEKR